jgi:hypothetical protein
MDSIGMGISVMILVLSAFAFMRSGRLAGMMLIVASILGFVTGGGIPMGISFLGGIFCMACGGKRVTMGGNYT